MTVRPCVRALLGGAILLFAVDAPIFGQERKSFDLKLLQKSVVTIQTFAPDMEPQVRSGFLASKEGLVFAGPQAVGVRADSLSAIVFVVGVPSNDDPRRMQFFRAKYVPLNSNALRGLNFGVLKIAVKKGGTAFRPLPISLEKLSAGAPITVLGNQTGKGNATEAWTDARTISKLQKLFNIASYHCDGLIPASSIGGPWVNDKGEVVGITSSDRGLAIPTFELKAVIEAAKTKAVGIEPQPGPVDLATLPIPKSIPLTQSFWDITKGTAKAVKDHLTIENDGNSYWLTSKANLPESFHLFIRGTVKPDPKEDSPDRRYDTLTNSLFIRYACDDAKGDIREPIGERIHWTLGRMLVYKHGDVYGKLDQGNSEEPFTITIRKQGKALTVSVNNRMHVRLLDDQPLSGGKLSIGGFRSRLDLAQVTLLALDNNTPPNTGFYTKVAKESIIDVPKPAVRVALGPARMPSYELIPTLETDTALKLPGVANNTVVGGNGRYLIFRLAGKRRLAVFDVAKREVAMEAPTVDENALYAAGLNHLLILSPAQKKFVRWNLRTLKKEEPIPWPKGLDTDELSFACMGRASTGPLFVYQRAKNETCKIDLETGQVTRVNWIAWRPGGAPGPGSMHAYPDGSRLVGWGSDLEVAAIGKDSVSSFRPESALGNVDEKRPALPSADGRLIIGQSAILGRQLKSVKLGERFAKSIQFPAMEPGFYLALPPGHTKKNDFSNKWTYSQLEVCAEDGAKLFAIDGAFELKDDDQFPWYKRIFYYPYANLLVTLNYANNQVLLRRMNIREQIQKNPEDYLVVVSRPPAVKRGATLEYQPEVLSNRGGVKAKLISGPKGLSVSPEGKLSWAVPASGILPNTEVTIELTDRGGRELNYSFVIAVSE